MPRNTTPPNQRAFYESVWALVGEIRPSKVIAYGHLAQLAGSPAGMDQHTFAAFAAR